MIKIFTPLILLSLAAAQLTAQCNPDTEPPQVIAVEGLCLNFLPIAKKVSIHAVDLILSAKDNCTAQNSIATAIRKHGDGTGFPTDTSGNPQTNLTYNCNEYGLQLIELWARDAAGNTDSNTVIVAFSDLLSVCGIDPFLGDGCAFTEKEELLPLTTWEFDLDTMPVFHPCFPHPPYTSGCLHEIFIGSNSTTIRPTLNSFPLNGVSTYDLVLISKHILGLEPLDSPYKILAADANNSKSVSTFDIVELRKLILGIYSKLPNQESWRFVLKNFVFPDPSNPFATQVPSTVLYDWHDPQETDFVGYKIGDMNGNASTNAQTLPDERSTIRLRLPDQLIQPGETVQLPLSFDDDLDVLGLQFALEFDPAQFEITGLTLSERLSSDQATSSEFYAQPRPGLLTFSWDHLSAPKLPAGEALLFLKIKATQPIQLAKTLRLQTEQLSPELYTADGASYRLNLDFLAAPNIEQTRIFPAAPNPSSGAVYIPVALAASETIRLEVFDLQGRQVCFLEKNLPQGLQHLEIPATVLNGSGATLLYRVQVGEIVQSGKLMRF